MSVKQRLIAFAKSQERSVRAFEIKSGLTVGYINAIRVSIQPDKIQSIASHYPSLNTSWLLTGEGEMLRFDTDKGRNENDPESSGIQNAGEIRTLMDAYNRIVDALHGISRSNEILAKSNFQMSENNSKLHDTNAKLVENMTAIMNEIKELKIERGKLVYKKTEASPKMVSDVKGKYGLTK